MRFEIVNRDDESITFILYGVGAPIANALRRILLADIPTMAIDAVNLQRNTSIIQDEVLAHRLGLIPIRAEASDEELVFHMSAKCQGNKGIETIRSDTLTWYPVGDQAHRYASDPPRVVHDDITVAKLRPGQEIEAELIVRKGVGRTDAKWSPVAMVEYRMLPSITLNRVVDGDDAEQLLANCPGGVFDLEDMGTAVVANPSDCTSCGACQSVATIGRNPEAFRFKVESLGIYTPESLVERAILTLKAEAKKHVHA